MGRVASDDGRFRCSVSHQGARGRSRYSMTTTSNPRRFRFTSRTIASASSRSSTIIRIVRLPSAFRSTSAYVTAETTDESEDARRRHSALAVQASTDRLPPGDKRMKTSLPAQEVSLVARPSKAFGCGKRTCLRPHQSADKYGHASNYQHCAGASP